MYNVAIVGGGPAGIFTALEITKLKPDWKVLLIEKGRKIEKRICPIREGQKNALAARLAVFYADGAEQAHFQTAN